MALLLLTWPLLILFFFKDCLVLLAFFAFPRLVAVRFSAFSTIYCSIPPHAQPADPYKAKMILATYSCMHFQI
jgi:hypothetical protein